MSTDSNKKVCFVTTGATAPFTGLIEAVLQPSSIDALRACGYTHLLIQYGSAKHVMAEHAGIAVQRLKEERGNMTLDIDGFDFDHDGLKTQFKLVQDSKGLVISHAEGSGSILAALRFQIPLIVVPNTQLLDNHQEDLAIAMERSNYLIRGDVTNLAPAIKKSETFKDQMAQFPPITSGKHRETKSFAAVMDETMDRGGGYRGYRGAYQVDGAAYGEYHLRHQKGAKDSALLVMHEGTTIVDSAGNSSVKPCVSNPPRNQNSLEYTV